MPTTAKDFLPSGGTIVLPSGKIIYADEIAIQKLSLRQIADVTWTLYDPSTGNVISTQVFPAGFITDPIDNAYIGSDGKIYVEVDGMNQTARASIDHTTFDVSILETLPSSDQTYADAQAKSDEANTAAEGGLFYDLFGISTTKGLIYTGIAVLGISYISRKI